MEYLYLMKCYHMYFVEVIFPMDYSVTGKNQECFSNILLKDNLFQSHTFLWTT